jgi:hypothetical protein
MPIDRRESELRRQAHRINQEIDAALDARRASTPASDYASRSGSRLVLDGLLWLVAVSVIGAVMIAVLT